MPPTRLAMTDRVSKFRVAIYGVLIEGGRLLMTETKVPSGTVFNLPGGGLELGESPREALEREYHEETKTSVRIEKLLYCSQAFHQNPDYPTEQLMHIYYLVRRDAVVPLPSGGNGDDVQGLAWVTLAELESLRIMPVDREFLESDPFLSLFS